MTAELIKNCEFVICHSSTSIQLAVLFQKPLIFVTTDELELTSFGKEIEIFANQFGKVKINLNKNLDRIDWKKELQIDYSKYAEYKTNYIKLPGTRESLCWDIINESIKLNI